MKQPHQLPITDQSSITPAPDPQQTAPDYYIENGLLVFTEAYHLRRGHCCRSGCRHCPYGFKRSK